jgi:hypothetical protein
VVPVGTDCGFSLIGLSHWCCKDLFRSGIAYEGDTSLIFTGICVLLKISGISTCLKTKVSFLGEL